MITLIARADGLDPSITSTSSPSMSTDDVDTFTLAPTLLPSPISSPASTNSSSSGSQISGATVFVAALAAVVGAVCIVLGITCLIMRVRRNSPRRYRKAQQYFPHTPIIIADDSTFPALGRPLSSHAGTPTKSEFGSSLTLGRNYHERASSNGSFLGEMPGDTTWMKEPMSPPPPVWDHLDEDRTHHKNLYPPSPRYPV